jgi:hypothetical protein
VDQAACVKQASPVEWHSIVCSERYLSDRQDLEGLALCRGGPQPMPEAAKGSKNDVATDFGWTKWQ